MGASLPLMINSRTSPPIGERSISPLIALEVLGSSIFT
jgi:hypothetical protein